MTTRIIPMQRRSGQWHRCGKDGWQPVSGPSAPLISAILDVWPEAIVTIEVPEQPKETSNA